jgi:pyruvyltransferase
MIEVPTFWWNLVNNWGDKLTPLLLYRFSRIKAVWSPVDMAEIVCVGSILGNLVKPAYTGIVLGSGKLFEDGLVPPRAHILALRGPLTARGVKGEFSLGDPGLLADELVTISEKRHELGLVPHWSDHRLEHDPRFTKYDPVIIRSNHDPLDVIRVIGSCKKIVSSSLHGLILADAFNIPRRFEETAAWKREGGTFKVRDHNAALSLPFEVGRMQQANSNRVNDCKSSLWDAFRLAETMSYYGELGHE